MLSNKFQNASNHLERIVSTLAASTATIRNVTYTMAAVLLAAQTAFMEHSVIKVIMVIIAIQTNYHCLFLEFKVIVV